MRRRRNWLTGNYLDQYLSLQGGVYTKKSETYSSVFKNYPDVVTVEQMSEMLGISTKTAYKLLKENKIKHLMIGRIYKIPKYYILTYLDILDQKNSNK